MIQCYLEEMRKESDGGISLQGANNNSKINREDQQGSLIYTEIQVLMN